MGHDSFFCTQYPGAVGFPSERPNCTANIVGGEAASKLMIDSCVAEEHQHRNQPNLAEKRGAMFDESHIKCSIEIKNGMTSKKTNVKQTNELILHSYSVSTVQ